MLTTLHQIIVSLYLLAPLIALLLCFRATLHFRLRLIGAVILGLAIGASLEFVYAYLSSASIRLWQLLLTAYLATSLLLIVKAFDALISKFLSRLMFRPARPTAIIPNQLIFLGRFAILFCLGLPYVIASGMTYRPKVTSADNPQSLLGVDYAPVTFTSSDGFRLSAWWIPSTRPRAYNANRTVLLCPGLAADKSGQLVLIKQLVSECYNVLAIDFRAHGDSTGQFCTFGDLERRDVLAAVHWLRSQHPGQCQKIFGVGESTGAAALIAAAADRDPDGQAIAAIVAYSPFARLNELANDFSTQLFSKPIDALIVRIGLPIASAQTGADLARFSPAELVSHLWPRPILIIHSEADELIPWEQGEELYDAASFPKDHYWLERQDHRQTISDDQVAQYVLHFLNSAQPEPVI